VHNLVEPVPTLEGVKRKCDSTRELPDCDAGEPGGAFRNSISTSIYPRVSFPTLLPLRYLREITTERGPLYESGPHFILTSCSTILRFYPGYGPLL